MTRISRISRRRLGAFAGAVGVFAVAGIPPVVSAPASSFTTTCVLGGSTTLAWKAQPGVIGVQIYWHDTSEVTVGSGNTHFFNKTTPNGRARYSTPVGADLGQNDPTNAHGYLLTGDPGDPTLAHLVDAPCS
jgi:hypothetical protein